MEEALKPLLNFAAEIVDKPDAEIVARAVRPALGGGKPEIAQVLTVGDFRRLLAAANKKG